MYDVTVIGAGIVGGMLARELKRYRLGVCLLEKELDVACGSSKGNTGIVHGGYDPEPGTLKAKLNTAGTELLFEAARELHVPCFRNGSMVCAFGAEEDGAIRELYDRGQKNGTPDLRILTGDEARELEPELSESVSSALLVPNAGIVCPYELTIAAVGNAMDNGAELKRAFEVTTIERRENGFLVTAADGRTVESRFLVNCAGGYSDRVAEMAGDGFFRIVPRAGEYLVLDKAEGTRITHTVFQVPSAEGKGILVTPTADGNLLTGPTAAVVAAPKNKETTASGLETVKRLSLRSVPSIDYRQVITTFCGVRSSEKSGDFIILPSKTVPGLVHAAAIDSPGLTCSVAIAKYVVELLRGIGLVTEENPEFHGERENVHFFRELSNADKDAYIREHPLYGRVICRCESVSEGELIAAIRRNPPAVTVDGVKRRTRSGMGRCQGGFCAPYVMELLARENDMPLCEVTKKGRGSRMVKGRI